MAKNYIKPGEVIDYVNGTGVAILSGAPVVIGNQQMGIALVDIAIAATGSVAKEGVFSLAKNTSDAVTQGQMLWWDATAKEVINAPALNTFFIGYADQAELAATATVLVDLKEFSEEGPRTLTLAATGAKTLNVGDFGGGDLTVFAPNTAAQTINLPSVATIPSGSRLLVKKTGAAAVAITLDPSGSETIGGSASYADIDTDNDFAQFVSTGSGWELIHSSAQSEVINWTNNSGADVLSGAPVVIGNQQMGIVLVDVATGGTGLVAIKGVFSLPINDDPYQGQKLWWDASIESLVLYADINRYFIGYAAETGVDAITLEVDLAKFSEEGPRCLTLPATGAQTLNIGDFGGGDLVLLAPNTAAQTINLPSVEAIPNGAKLFVKKTDATAAAITLDPASTETIAGAATFATIDANNDFAQFVSTGTAWSLLHSTIAA